MSAPLHCLGGIPKGSRNRYEWDDQLGGIELDRFPALRIIEESRVRRREKRS